MQPLLVEMREVVAVVLVGTLSVAGCARHKSSLPPAGTAGDSKFSPVAGTPSNPKLIVTPENGLVGNVVKVNQAGRFVVLNFPIGHLPTLEQRLQVYRRGLKVGEIKVTGPQMDDNVVGDLVAGEASEGDQVRDQ